MQAFEDESARVLKKQRLCVAQIDAQLDFLLEEAAITRRQLVDKQDEFRRKKKGRVGDISAALGAVVASGASIAVAATTAAAAGECEPADENADRSNNNRSASGNGSASEVAHKDRSQQHCDDDDNNNNNNNNSSNEHSEQQDQQAQSDADALLLGLVRAAREKQQEDDDEEKQQELDDDDCDSDKRPAGVPPVAVKSRVFAEEEDSEVDNILQGFIHRVRLLNVEKNVADELRAIHVALSKYAKQIDKTFCNDITKVCRSQQFDHTLVCRLVAEYLYQDGQIEAADAICKEAELELATSYRECFVELHEILQALKMNDLAPALEWARKHRKELRTRSIEIEFELVRLQYVDLLESCSEAVDALKFATEQFSVFHDTHAKEIHRLMGCLVFKDRLNESPYKDLFTETRWEDIRTAIIRACCRLRSVPFKSYLDTCLSAGISALPAMRKLATVMESKLTNWESLEELPVEIPIANDLRFHTVFCCPVSKEESAPGNPPVLLKCGHAICKACVKRISFNMTRRFKCPTCPAEMTESETRELFF